MLLIIIIPVLSFSFVMADEESSEQAPSSTPLAGTCSANVAQILQDNNVSWTVNPSGGSGSYTYSWSGDQGLSGSGSSVTNFYADSGYANASVTISDGVDTLEVDCDPVQIIAYLRFNSCGADEISYTIGYGPTFWSASISGGVGPYTIEWAIDDGLNGSGSTKEYIEYVTAGQKNAQILGVSSGDGQTLSTISPANPTIINAGNPVTCSPNIMVYEDQVPVEEFQVSCSANVNSAYTGASVTWSAQISGGFEPYNLTWSGTDDLSGNTQSITTSYDVVGTKNATLLVTDSAISNNFKNVSCGSVEVNIRRSGGGGSSRRTSIDSDEDTTEEQNDQQNIDESENVGDDVEDNNIILNTTPVAVINTPAINAILPESNLQNEEQLKNVNDEESQEDNSNSTTNENEIEESELAAVEDGAKTGLLANVTGMPLLNNMPNYLYFIMGFIGISFLGSVAYFVWTTKIK